MTTSEWAVLASDTQAVTTATTLAAKFTGFTAANLKDARKAVITATAATQYTLDGTTPTATVGHTIPAAGTVTIEGKRLIDGLRFFAGSSSSVTITLLGNDRG